MKLWRRLISFFYRCHAPCSWCRVRVEFTGDAARTPVEALILKIAGGRQHAAFHWLEDRLAEALYDEERRKGGWVADIGIWGPDAFRREASEVLRHLRPEFGLFTAEAEIRDERGSLCPAARTIPS